MADDRLGRAHAGHHGRVERAKSSAKALGAHHDFNKARSSSGEAQGDVLTAALRPELERKTARVGAVEG